MHCTRSSSGCSGMQCIYARSGGFICLLYMCIVLDIVVDVALYKASMLIDWGCSYIMHCTRSSSGCSGMQGICAWLTGGFIFHLYICIVLDLALSVVVCKASVLNSVGGLILAMGGAVCKVSMLNWRGVYLPSIYMHCTRSRSGCSGMQGIYAWLTGGFICLLYICIVLYPAVGVALYKTSILDWLGSLSTFYIYALY